MGTLVTMTFIPECVACVVSARQSLERGLVCEPRVGRVTDLGSPVIGSQCLVFPPLFDPDLSLAIAEIDLLLRLKLESLARVDWLDR